MFEKFTFSARKADDIEYIRSTLPGWLERKNHRIHQATLRMPEKPALRQLLPSVYENSRLSYRKYGVGSQPYVLYKTVKYWIKHDYCFKQVACKIASGMIHIYECDADGNAGVLIRSFPLSDQKGANIQDPEDRRDNSDQWIAVAERLRSKWNCKDFQHFINGVKKENPRHVFKQLSAIERLLDAHRPSRELASRLLEACCRDWRYQYSQVEIYLLRMLKEEQDKADILSGRKSFQTPAAAVIRQPSLDFYSKAFADRCEKGAK